MTTLLKTVTPEMPNLQIVESERLVLHEHTDAQRSLPLARRLQSEGILRNPPVVAPVFAHPENHGGQKYVVLDGANRSTALIQLRLPAMVVQVVEYDSPEVRLSTWNHVVCEIAVESLLRDVAAIPGLILKDTLTLYARSDLARREILAYLECADGRALALHSDAHDLSTRTEILNHLVNTYKERGRLYRANTDTLADVADFYPNAAALVVFPHFEPVELQTFARDGILLPPGITRHVISGRAMRLNYPLVELARPGTVEEKNAFLAEWIREKMDRKEVRYYEEPTFLFDE